VLDTQFVNDHLKQFGCYEIDSAAYKARLAQALTGKADFTLPHCPPVCEDLLVTEYLENR
jgi:leucyl/phenylalanyl-tRNA--protein transferase